MIATILIFLLYLFLIITLIIATVQDCRNREVQHKTWIPYCMYAIPVLTFYWSSNICNTQYLISLVFAIGIILIGISANILYKAKCTQKLLIGFADCIALALIFVTLPTILNISAAPILILFILCSILVLLMIPKIKTDWNARGIPLLLPITIGTIPVIIINLII